MWINEDILKLANDIIVMAEKTQAELHTLRPLTSDRMPVFNGIVMAEVQMMSIKSELQKLRGYVNAAQTVGSLPRDKPATPYPDGRTAAAHDDTLFE